MVQVNINPCKKSYRAPFTFKYRVLTPDVPGG
jgi:hypothetical protein